MSNLEHDKIKGASRVDLHLGADNREAEVEEDEAEDIEEIEVDTTLFAQGLRLFPCFLEAPREGAPDDLFELVFSAYQAENLLEEQDHVVELLLHLQEEDSPFNLNRALEVWSHEDRQAFLQLVTSIDSKEDEED